MKKADLEPTQKTMPVGNFRDRADTNPFVHVMRLLPASIRRAFSLMWFRVRGVVGETPLLFFGVVLGFAMLFRAGSAWFHEPPVEEAPTFATVAPSASAASASTRSTSTATGADPTATSTAQVGAAARVEPLGAPARVAPRVRGHGRRAPAIQP